MAIDEILAEVAEKEAQWFLERTYEEIIDIRCELRDFAEHNCDDESY